MPAEYAHILASAQSVARSYLKLPRHTQKIVRTTLGCRV